MKRGTAELCYTFFCGQIPPVVKAEKRNEEEDIVHNWLPVDVGCDPVF